MKRLSCLNRNFLYLFVGLWGQWLPQYFTSPRASNFYATINSYKEIKNYCKQNEYKQEL